MGDARANIAITATTSKLSSALAEARQKIGSFAGAVSRGIGGAFKKLSLGDAGKNALGHFGGNMMTRGFDAIVDTADQVRNFERNLVRFGIASGKSAGDLASMRKEIRQISRDTAIADADIMQGASTYVALTGDADGATKAMSAFARIAQASGASVSDVAQATAAMKTSMGLNANEIEDAFSAMIVQGKGGAVELKDLAGELATLGPQFAQFRGGKSLSGIREMGAAFQTIMTGSGSAAEASTKFQALIGELSNPQNVKALGKLKIKVFDKDPKTGVVSMRNFSDIAEDLANNEVLKDPRKLSEIFGRKEARQAIIALQEHIGLFRQLKQQGEDTGAVQRDLMTFMQSDAGRLDTAINKLKVSLVEAFTPERIQAFTNAVENLVEKVEPLVGAIGKMGDVLGGIYDVGRKVRGFFDSGPTPFGNALDASRDYQTAHGDGAWIMTPQGKMVRRDSKEGQAQVYGAQLREKHREGYESSKAAIMGAEKNERTSKESINAAIAAYYSGNIGSKHAGRVYLRNAGYAGAGGDVDKERIQAIVNENMKTFGVEFAKGIKDALGNFTIDIGSDKVVDATRKSGANRTRP